MKPEADPVAPPGAIRRLQRAVLGARHSQADLLVLTLFFAYVLLVENALILLWALAVGESWVTAGQPPLSVVGIYSSALLLSGAASFLGGLVGFLFGVPRSEPANDGAPATILRNETVSTDDGTQVAQAERREIAVPSGDRDAGAPRTRLRSNTNLESISDALTKALIGIGLSQINSLGGWVRGTAAALGPMFGPGASGGVVAVCILVYGAAAGFFFGYLATRIYLTGVFRRND